MTYLETIKFREHAHSHDQENVAKCVEMSSFVSSGALCKDLETPLG